VTAKYPNLRRLFSRREVVTVASFWPVWVRSHMNELGVLTTMVDDATPESDTKYSFRFPVKQDSTPFRYISNLASSDDEQANVDAVLKYLVDAGVTAVCFLWYPTADLITVGDNTIVQTLIWEAFEKYQASEYYGAIKFCLSLQSAWVAYDGSGTWGNIGNFCGYFAELVADPQYLFVTPIGTATPRPLVFMYDSSPAVSWDAPHTATVRTAMTVGGAAPLFVQSNNNSTFAGTILAYGICSYGPQGAQPTGSGHLAYGNQYAKDRANLTAPTTNAKRVLTVTHGFDGRPISGRGESTWWGDTPGYSQWETSLNWAMQQVRADASRCPDAILNVHSAGEWAENGAFFPSAQTTGTGPNSPSAGPIVDAIENCIAGSFPSPFWEYWHGSALLSELDGGAPDASWTIAGSITGAWEYAEFRNSTAGKTRTWLPGSVSGYKYDRLQIWGPNGAAFGSSSVVLNGGAPTTVNQNAVSTTHHVLLWDSGDLTASAAHSVVVTISSGLVSHDMYRARRVRP
jgi:hypothetical protein